MDILVAEEEATTLDPLNTEEKPLIVEDTAYSDEYPANEDQAAVTSSVGVANRVSERKKDSSKFIKTELKRQPDIPLPHYRFVKQKESLDKEIVTVALEDVEDEDIHGKNLKISSYFLY